MTAMTPGQRVRAYLLGAPRFHLIAIGVLVLLLSVLQVSKMIAMSNLEDVARVQQNTLRTQAKTAFETRTDELLRLSATPLGWAVRSAMLTSSYADIDVYLAKMVHLKHVKRVVLTDNTGRIIATTNLKLKGDLVFQAFPGVDLSITEFTIQRIQDIARVVVPINDFTRRIGTLIFEYSDDPLAIGM